ncbi:MAG: hypothetical protein NUW37_07870 [Planctomycetes bacterium]|nr:hypothetical protein [Planctomycetota bacterium]
MPRRKVKYLDIDEKTESELIDAIDAEIRRTGDENSSDDNPQVLVEDSHLTEYRHYYVIWDRFEDVDEDARGRVIWAALKKALRSEELLKVTVTLGYTKEEAEELGIEAGDCILD